MADQITISSLSLRYSRLTPEVLSSLSIEIGSGSCCAILGPTGAGKSSLLHSIAGTMRKHHPESVSTGSIQIGSRKFEGLPEEIMFPIVGLTLQDPHVQISGVRDTVYDEILFTLENIGAVPHAPESVILPLLRRLGVEHLADRHPGSLSGGETQRVALATILVARPSVLLLDEPATALDLAARNKLQTILRAMKGSTTIVLTDTHLDFALGICDKIIVLEHGTLKFEGTPGEFIRRLEDFAHLIPLDSWHDLGPKIIELMDQSSGHSSSIAKAIGIV